MYPMEYNINNTERQIKLLQLDNGKVPFEDWYKNIKGLRVKQAVLAILTRLQNPEFQNYKVISNGIYELRIFLGAGYRIYFAFEKKDIVIIIMGGDKSTQKKDIFKAQNFWNGYKNETKKNRKKFII